MVPVNILNIKTIDWNEREKELIDLCNKYRKKDGSFDCVVPSSGGKDSAWVAHELKVKYNMHPLDCYLVSIKIYRYRI